MPQRDDGWLDRHPDAGADHDERANNDARAEPVADASCDAKSDKSRLPRNMRRRHATAVLNPRVASASFVDETVWIPRGVPSVAEFAEVAGGLSAYAFSYEPELVVDVDVAARAPGAARSVEAIIRRGRRASPGPDRVHAGDVREA